MTPRLLVLAGAVLAVLLSAAGLTAASEPRVALVIGNAGNASARLKNPVNDAEDMARALTDLGFTVIKRTDASKRDMENAVYELGDKLKHGGVGLFFYAGHGMQVGGRNYLIPVDARIESESDVAYESLDAGRVLGKMQDAGNRLNIVILDACRNNPFGRGFRSAPPQGLATMDAPIGSIVAFSTAPGSVAEDGGGRNGTYTKHLLAAMRTPGLAITDMFMHVRREVLADTSKRQQPWENTSLTDRFYFLADSGGAVVDVPQAKPAPASEGTLIVEPDQAQASVQVDGRQAGRGRVELRLKPGDHTVRVELSGFGPFQQTVSIDAGRTRRVMAYLEAEARTGRLFVKAEPSDATVKVLNIAEPYRPGLELDPGKYQIQVSREGYEPQEQWVSVVAGEDLDVSISLTAKQVNVTAAQAYAANMSLINGIDAEFPPYSFIDKSGKAKGFDVESLDWIAKKMGFTVKHQPIDWKSIIPALAAGKIDCIASGMSATAERAKVVSFTNPYKTIQQVLVVKKNTVLTINEIMNSGSRIGVQRGTTEAKWLDEHKGKNGFSYRVVLYDNSPLAVQDLLSRRIDASAMDDDIANDIAKVQPITTLGEYGMPPEYYAYAVRKDDKKLLDLLNRGLDLLMKDPYWEELKRKWEID